MNMYQNFKKQNINLGMLNIEEDPDAPLYFCTPKGARLIGWTGVDGIHYCFIRGFGEMVFAISPMNEPGEYVHPIAKDFTDFLRLLLACKSEAALEQAWRWSEEEFTSFVNDTELYEKQQIVLQEIQEKLQLTPMEQPYRYIKELQESFDYGNIRFSEDYEEWVPVEPKLPEWKVRFEDEGRAGKEITVSKEFIWAGEKWLIPAIYLCAKGLVVDFCKQALTEDALEERFRTEVNLNGKTLKPKHGIGMVWNPYQPSGWYVGVDERAFVEHYGLDKTCGWSLHRVSFPWETKRRPQMKSLRIRMEQEPVDFPGIRFRVEAPGESVCFEHPITHTTYTLTVHEYEPQKFDEPQAQVFGSDEYEYPTNYYVMSYTISPELPGNKYFITDTLESDMPRERMIENDSMKPKASVGVSAIAVIGGASGPTVITMNHKEHKLHAVCSSLHFEPVEKVEWKMIFREKTKEDIEINIIE